MSTIKLHKRASKSKEQALTLETDSKLIVDRVCKNLLQRFETNIKTEMKEYLMKTVSLEGVEQDSEGYLNPWNPPEARETKSGLFMTPSPTQKAPLEAPGTTISRKKGSLESSFKQFGVDSNHPLQTPKRPSGGVQVKSSNQKKPFHQISDFFSKKSTNEKFFCEASNQKIQNSGAVLNNQVLGTTHRSMTRQFNDQYHDQIVNTPTKRAPFNLSSDILEDRIESLRRHHFSNKKSRTATKSRSGASGEEEGDLKGEIFIPEPFDFCTPSMQYLGSHDYTELESSDKMISSFFEGFTQSRKKRNRGDCFGTEKCAHPRDWAILERREAELGSSRKLQGCYVFKTPVKRSRGVVGGRACPGGSYGSKACNYTA